MITKVTVAGDLVEVTSDDGRVVRRHVEGYNSLSITQKQQLWQNIIGEPVAQSLPELTVPAPVTPEPEIAPEIIAEPTSSFWQRLVTFIWG